MALLLLHRARDGDDLPLAHQGPAGASRARADILVAAIGRPAFVTPDFVKPGATVIDVGINRVADEARGRASASPTGSRKLAAVREARVASLVGDVHPAVDRGRRRADAGAGRRRAADDRDAAARTP